jgi:hypothetical protein
MFRIARPVRVAGPEAWSLPSFAARPFLAGACLSAVAAILVAAPPRSSRVGHYVYDLRLLIFALAALAAALALSANAVVLLSFFFFGASQDVGSQGFFVGSASVYTSDLLVMLLVLRALLPRDRLPTGPRFTLPTRIAIGALLAVAAFTAVRGYEAGTPIPTVVRDGSFVLYWTLLYFSFQRIFRERDFDERRFLKGVVYTSLAFVGFMAAMRAINHPFDRNPHSGSLAVVPTTAGNFRRDYGFGSAYTIYPSIAILALGVSFYASRLRLRWVLVSIVCVVATLATLVRGSIYGLVIGAVVLAVSSGIQRRGIRLIVPRRGAILGMLAGLAVAVVIVSAVAPRYGIAVAERSLPFLHQSEGADLNAEYRTHALATGIQVARVHPLGMGYLDVTSLTSVHHIDPSLLDHSGPAALLVYSGWAGIIAFVAVLVAFAVESHGRRRAWAWAHPVFLGISALLVTSSFAAAGIVGQSWVVGTGALLLASRFALPRQTAVAETSPPDSERSVFHRA